MLPRIVILLLIVTDAILFGTILLHGKNIQVLNPQGQIALQERNLMITAVLIMLIVIIPVFILAIYVATKFHSKNTKATYTPDWDHNLKLQIFVWAFPTAIICVLSVMNWIYAHKLDPRNAIVSNNKTMVIQVVALRWKWLFIYPSQRIATVNFIEIPQKTPIAFELTASDTPMNSFWIPQLDGQIYAMPGMATETHLIADTTGVYRGSDAEINGAGFSDMTFTVKSVIPQAFSTWVESVKQSPKTLTYTSVRTLSKPSQDQPITYYSSTENNLFNTIVMQYMYMPTPSQSSTQNNSGQMPQMSSM